MLGHDLVSRVLERSLEASSLRQRVLAHNIANVNTPGFKRSRVEFEANLANALQTNQPEAAVPEVVQEIHSLARPDGNNVDIELEMSQLAENQIWHAALVRQLSDHFARLRTVVYDGRR